MSSDARKLEELEAAGVDFSRNRNFDFFADPDNRRARDLRRRLGAWADLIRAQHAAGDLRLRVIHEQGGRVALLELSFPSLSGRCSLRLSRAEYELLRREDGLGGLLAADEIRPPVNR